MFDREKPRPGACRRCEKTLSLSDFEYGRALMLLGRAYCATCLKEFRRHCYLCRKYLGHADFESGRAMTLGSEMYCDGCLGEAIRISRPSAVLHPSVVQTLRRIQDGIEQIDQDLRTAAAPAVEKKPPVDPAENDWESRREHGRFVPPENCSLALRPGGVKGLLRSLRVPVWLDVSEGGLRAVVEGKFEAGDLLRGTLRHASLADPFDFDAEVRYAKPAEKYPNSSLIGVQFKHPSRELRAFIRVMLGETRAATPKNAKPESTEPPARSA